jgi:membrane associated rhomboid family serine protease
MPAHREPIFNAPGIVTGAIAALVAIHVLVWVVLPDRLTNDVLELFAFIPARYTGQGESLAGGSAAMVWTFFSHQLLHGDWTHLLLNCAWLLVFGGAVAVRIGTTRFIAFGLLSGAAGAIAFLAWRIGDPIPMIGASGGVSGLMGGAFRFFFAALDHGGFDRFRLAPRSVPLMSVAEVLRDKRFQAVAVALVLINLLTSLASPVLTAADGIAWQAHLGGFLFGLLTFHLFEPPRRARPDLTVVPPPRSKWH